MTARAVAASDVHMATATVPLVPTFSQATPLYQALPVRDEPQEMAARWLLALERLLGHYQRFW